MALSFQPFFPWHIVVLVLISLTTIGLLSRGIRDHWVSLGRRPVTRTLVLLFSLLAGIALVIAAFNPVVVTDPDTEKAHLVFAMDVSDSVLRTEGGFDRLRDRLQKRVASSIAAIPKERRAHATVDLITFRDGYAFSNTELPLQRLPRAISALDRHGFASGDGSNIATALEEAANRIEKVGTTGAVILASDGNQTAGDSLAQAQRLASLGVPIHIYPIESGFPELAIVSADLPRQVHSRNLTYIRGVMRNASNDVAECQLKVSRNGPLSSTGDHFGGNLIAQHDLSIDNWMRLRQPIVFQGFGLQFVDVALGDGDGGDHLRRFFTHVNRPPKILAIGGDFRWCSALSEDDAELIKVKPEEVATGYNIMDFDAVVVSGVVSSRLGKEVMERIVRAVEVKGLGFFLINGDHAGQSEESETVLMSYKATPLQKLLPVHPGPRPFMPDPPPRQIVLLVDTSGSMGGERLQKSQDICRYIIENLLRPKDTLDLLTFTTGVGHLVKKRNMDEGGKRYALSKVNGMKAGGGTDPKAALKLIAHRRMTDCGLIFISDGEFGDVSYRPDCRATVFAIGAESVPGNSPLRKLADPFPVGKNFSPSSIRIPFFQPKPRKKFYEREDFKPLRIERFLREADTLPLPDFTLPGSAVSHIKSEADLVGVRPKLTDPTLAFMDVGRGRSGVFTSALSDDWIHVREGRNAIRRWVREIISYTARDRYEFSITDRGETMDMEMSIVPTGGYLPAVDHLAINVEMDNGDTEGVLLRPDPLIPGKFVGQVRLTRTGKTRRAIMHVREVGPDSLSRPQRIPMLVPPDGLVTGAMKGEAYSFGINEPLLQELADIGGGTYDPPADMPMFRRKAAMDGSMSLVKWFLLCGFLFYLMAFGMRRWDP